MRVLRAVARGPLGPFFSDVARARPSGLVRGGFPLPAALAPVIPTPKRARAHAAAAAAADLNAGDARASS